MVPHHPPGVGRTRLRRVEEQKGHTGSHKESKAVRDRQGGPWEDLGWQELAGEGKGLAWAGEVAQRKPQEGLGPVGASCSGPIQSGVGLGKTGLQWG